MRNEEEPRVIKHYSNTHGAADRRVILALHLAVSLGDIKKVAALLSDPAINIDETTETDKYKNITAYNVACFYGHPEIAELLLRHDANSEIQLLPMKFAYPGISAFRPTESADDPAQTRDASFGSSVDL